MTMGTERFKIMLQEFVEIANDLPIDSETLETLKQEYKDRISSTRTFDNIRDIRSLIKVLEKRDVVRYDDISELKNIEQGFIKNERAKELIANYEEWLRENHHNISDLYANAVVPRTEPIQVPGISNESSIPLYGIESGVNIGVTTRATISLKQVHHGVNQALNSLHQDRQKELQCLVLKEISKRVGRHWKDISRKLNLQESVLQEIEVTYSDEVMGFQKMFNQAVEIFFAENHPNWKLQLLQALESARRRDLKETAQEIILRYDSINS